MTIGLLFWVLMLLWLVFGFFRDNAAFGGWGPFGHSLLLWILLALLGWRTFGPMLHA